VDITRNILSLSLSLCLSLSLTHNPHMPESGNEAPGVKSPNDNGVLQTAREYNTKRCHP
jgi:hypothetical protein